ncbi:hypothetical protein JYP46_01525 [Nitratireductor aquimarinus]|uniref:hypothetical protein n=1 Tax=Alphaproteobacteria TaxID=28211 RepID=UPI0019D39D29|nr:MULTISPECIES: hypothetical protein [Alphaproteobacteria]MBN7755491.1 hypothetical protein [Nitratireductor aquimarinus]MBY5998246.1 hypothetical protein [Tritonibacter mobilis]MBY6020274.1 hypothetical protein [Nitratireductor sp. DP7N14-4]
MGKKSAPPPPDPRETSAAQTGTSVATAIANSWLGNVDRVGPDGTTTWSQSGETSFTDPYTGKTYTVPRFTETVNLSPEQQAIYDREKAAESNLAGLAEQQSGFLKDYMAQPVDLSNEAVESRLYELGSKRLDPRFQREEEAMRTNLINRGIREGTDAFSAAMSDFNQGKNDAYNSLLLSGRGQAVQEALTERNQPINEISALLSGAQVSMPQFTGGQMPQIPTTDNAGIIQQDYQNRLGAWQQKNAMMGGLFGGLLGLGGKMIGLSDDDTKTDKQVVGEVEPGMNLHAYRYKGEPKSAPLRLGLMASEVEKKHPDAVKRGRDGLRRVDYSKALSLEAR